MAVQNEKSAYLTRVAPEGSPWVRRVTIVVYAATALLLLVAGVYALVGSLVERTRVAIDDIRYGRPRHPPTLWRGLSGMAKIGGRQPI